MSGPVGTKAAKGKDEEQRRGIAQEHYLRARLQPAI